MRIRHRFLSPPALQIGMHHLADDRSRPDNRDLDDDVVEGFRPQPRQRRHLRARLHLKDPDGVRLLQHAVHGRVVGGKMGEVERIVGSGSGVRYAGSGMRYAGCEKPWFARLSVCSTGTASRVPRPVHHIERIL